VAVAVARLLPAGFVAPDSRVAVANTPLSESPKFFLMINTVTRPVEPDLNT
jgi:hypothetical protein